MLLIVALILVAIVAVFVLFELGLLAVELQGSVDRITKDIHYTMVVAGNATFDADQAAKQATLASTQVAAAAAEQRAYWNKTSLETYKTMASLRLTIVRADHSLNDVVVPQLVHSMQGTDDLMRQTTSDVHQTAVGLQPVLQELARASAAAASTMADPAIHETIVHLDETSAHAAETAEQTAQTVAHLNATASDVQAFVHRETTPVRGTWNVIKAFLREFAGPAAQVATAAK